MLEILFECGVARCAQVERAAAVMFAETGRSADAQDFRDRLAAIELAPDDAELIFGGTECRHDLQLDAAGGRRVAHMHEGARGAWREPLRTRVDVLSDECKEARFAYHAQLARAAIFGGNTQRPRLRDDGTALTCVTARGRFDGVRIHV